VDLETRVSDLTRAQKKADADVEQVKSRRARNQQRLDTGAVSSPRELEQLQHEVSTLDRRIATLEDEELEVMEQLETAQASLSETAAALDELQGKATELEAARDEAVADIDAQARDRLAERERLVATVPEALLALYERLRAQAAGIGAAALRRRRCEGCRLELTAADLADVAAAPSDEVLRCPQCNRILVRTAESGV
jgi:predicted  nucleic acid-binding Zn-ribbon protein